MRAGQLLPALGSPYNQMAILAQGVPDVLSASYYFLRSLSVARPFPSSKTNMTVMMRKIVDRKQKHGDWRFEVNLLFAGLWLAALEDPCAVFCVDVFCFVGGA